jgi:hypothetical protein
MRCSIQSGKLTTLAVDPSNIITFACFIHLADFLPLLLLNLPPPLWRLLPTVTMSDNSNRNDCKIIVDPLVVGEVCNLCGV